MNDTIRKLASEVYKILGFSFDVDIFDKSGARVYDPASARSFYAKPGKIMVTLTQKNDRYELTVNLSEHIPIEIFEKKIGHKLRNIVAKNGNVKYNIRTYGKEIKPKDFAEQISSNGESNMTSQDIHEGMYGTTRSSYQKVGECKVIIRHEGRVNEEKFGARSRFISAIFVETRAGERFKLAENNLHGARALARHLSNGGSPFDTVGVKVTEMMKEMAELKKMIKETKSHIKESPNPTQAIALQEQIKTKFISLRETLKQMGGANGYKGMMSTINENLAGYQPDQSQELDDPSNFDNENEWFHAVMTYIKRKLKSNQVRKADKQITKADALAMLNLSNDNKNLFLELSRQHAMAGTDMAEADGSEEPMAFMPSSVDFTELARKMGDVLSNPAGYSEELVDYFKKDENYVDWSRMISRLEDQGLAFSAKLTPAEERYLNVVVPFLKMGDNESVNEEKKTLKTKERSAEKDAGDQVQDMIDFARDEDVSADDLFSANKGLKENAVLESWFDRAADLEFFNEEDLVLPEDTTPIVEFETHSRLNEFHKGSELSDAFSMMDDYMSQRRMGADEAVEKAARFYADEYHNGDEQAFEQAKESLNQMAQGAGLINHDAGRTFADDVLSKDVDIRTHQEEIRSEEFYGDARFEEIEENTDGSDGCKDSKQLNSEASGPYVGEEVEGDLDEASTLDYDDDSYDDDEYDDRHEQKHRDMKRKGQRRQRDDKRFGHMDEKTNHDLSDEINAKEVARIVELSKYRT